MLILMSLGELPYGVEYCGVFLYSERDTAPRIPAMYMFVDEHG